MNRGPELALFDFDKTLISSDSFRLFARLGARSSVERARVFADAVACKLGLFDNRRYKERVLDRVWRGRTKEARGELLDRHAKAMRQMEIDAAWRRLRSHLDAGDAVAVLSASPEFYLVPFVATVSPAIEVHGSKVSEGDAGCVVDNLFRDRKADCGRALIERLRPCRTVVYTDHVDDVGLMRLADEVQLVRPSERTQRRVRSAGIAFEVLEA